MCQKADRKGGRVGIKSRQLDPNANRSERTPHEPSLTVGLMIEGCILECEIPVEGAVLSSSFPVIGDGVAGVQRFDRVADFTLTKGNQR